MNDPREAVVRIAIAYRVTAETNQSLYPLAMKRRAVKAAFRSLLSNHPEWKEHEQLFIDEVGRLH